MNLRIVKLNGTFKELLDEFNAPVQMNISNKQTSMYSFEDAESENKKLACFVFATDSFFNNNIGYFQDTFFAFKNLERKYMKRLNIVYDERGKYKADSYIVFLGSASKEVCEKVYEFIGNRIVSNSSIKTETVKIVKKEGKKFTKEYV